MGSEQVRIILQRGIVRSVGRIGQRSARVSRMKRSLVGVSQIAFRLASSGGLGWLALRALDWDLVRGELEGVSVSLIVLAVAVFMFASYLRAYRWQPSCSTR